MKKHRKKMEEEGEMLREYDFKGKKGVRGKYHRAYKNGHRVQIYEEDGAVSIHYFTPKEGAIMLDPDVKEYFPDSEAVNATLRSLIALIPERNSR